MHNPKTELNLKINLFEHKMIQTTEVKTKSNN